MTNFNLTEEAFILSSLKEVVHVWARGSGQATFNLNIVDGVADLQLGFRLGQPTDPHLPHEQCEPHHILPPDHHPIRPRKRRKGPARRESDRARAAQHQARFQPDATAVSSCAHKQAGAGALKLPPVILPIIGKLLPVKPISATPSNASAPAATPPPSAPPPPVTTAPTKTAAAATPKGNIDFNSARKHLFSNVPSSQKPTLAQLEITTKENKTSFGPDCLKSNDFNVAFYHHKRWMFCKYCTSRSL